MAKKQTKKAEVETPQPTASNEMQQVVIEKKVKTPVKKGPEDGWEIKDRMYFLKNNQAPLTYTARGSNIFYFDEEKGYERELKYTNNQRTPFVDEFKGDARLEHIVFENGSLFVPRNKVVLQKLLSLYHPHRDTIWEEHKPVEQAAQHVDWLEFEAKAMIVALDLDVEMAEAVMRVEIGSKVAEMSSKELRRDLLVFAKKNPRLFLELVTDDNVKLRNFGIKATELGIISLSSDQRHFTWASNDRKLMTVPFDEHPYSALAQWFKTDEGMEIYSNIEKRLNS
jgi:hypothetical protein